MLLRTLIPFLLLLLSLDLATAASQPRFALYNLSILVPLPKAEIAEVPGLEALGCARPLLEESLFASLPRLTPTRANLEKRYSDVRLVGLRYDLISEELRLVLQPLYFGSPANLPGKTIKGDDAAIHLFFRMPREAILKTQERLAKQFPQLPKKLLGVHPGLASPAGKAVLQELVCEAASLSLFKVTFMNVRGNRFIWNFGGFHVAENARGERARLQDVQIANTSETFLDERDSNMSVQQLRRFSGSLNGDVIPRPREKGDHMLNILDVGVRLPKEQIPKLRLAIDRIENPELNNPSSVDCMSCHATESARIFAEGAHASLPSAAAFPLDTDYDLDASISRTSLKDTANFRAFGYLDRDACINRRVLNESVQMQREAELLNRLQNQ